MYITHTHVYVYKKDLAGARPPGSVELLGGDFAEPPSGDVKVFIHS